MSSEPPTEQQFINDITESMNQLKGGEAGLTQGPPDTFNGISTIDKTGHLIHKNPSDAGLTASHPATHSEPGGPILKHVENTGHELHEAGKGIFGTVERWSKSAWEAIKHAWHFLQEHVPSLFSPHHWTAGWTGLAVGAGVVGIAKGADVWRQRRARKRQEAQGH